MDQRSNKNSVIREGKLWKQALGGDRALMETKETRDCWIYTGDADKKRTMGERDVRGMGCLVRQPGGALGGKT